MKRRYSPEKFDEFDSENVDPSIFNSPSKKSKGIEGYPFKAAASQFELKTTSKERASVARPIITPARLNSRQSSVIQEPKRQQPSSAPAAAGRSPKSKRIGILSRKRYSSSPFTRVDPPSFGLSSGLPFSIDAALSGTIPSYKPKPTQYVAVPTLEESVPNSWVFDIHEDTAEEEMGNLMQHSTCTLDISDDEGRLAAKDQRGKENIPPIDYLNTFVATSRQDTMIDEARTPLGDLDARSFYAEDCDSSSVVIVPADQKCNEKALKRNDLRPYVEDLKNLADIDCKPSNQWIDHLAPIQQSKQDVTIDANFIAGHDGIPAAEIEIWENASAKADDEPSIEPFTPSPTEAANHLVQIGNALSSTF